MERWRSLSHTLASLLVATAGAAWGEDFFVAQGAGGTADASSCTNAWSLATLNSASSWGIGAGRVSPGDSIRFCGTVTGQWIIQGSGTTGNVITVTAEPGSTFSRTHWTAPAIRASQNRSFLRLTALTVTATASGSGRNPGTADGIQFAGACDHCEFDHLSLTNLYVRTAQSRDTAAPIGLHLNSEDLALDFDNLSIHHSTFSHAIQGVKLNYPAGSSSNWSFFNNRCSQVGSCVWIGSGNSNRTLDGVSVYDNDVSDLAPWSGCFNAGCPGDNWHHCDGLIHIFAAHPSTSVTGLRIFSNYLHGASCYTTEYQFGNTTTSWLFVEGLNGGVIQGPLIYNNVLAAGSTADGQIYLKGATSAVVAHNTIISNSNTTSVGCLNSTFTVVNNIATQVGGSPISNEGGCSGTSNYNNFFGYSYLQNGWGAGANGSTNNPRLAPSHQLTAQSPGQDTGMDAASLCPGCVTDQLHRQRPQGPGWDMGAFETPIAAGAAPAAPAHLAVSP